MGDGSISSDQAGVRRGIGPVSSDDGFRRILAVWFLSAVCILLLPVVSWAHGFAGKRFFPTTFAVDDPFVSDEFSLLFNHVKSDPEVKTTSLAVELSKRITPNLGISVGEQYQHISTSGNGSENGFGNIELGIKYQFLTNEEHETIMSIGLGTELGGTGTRRVGAESFSVVSPAFFFGKGFGDLPESAKFLRPLAVTGVVGPNFPTRSRNVIFNPDTGETETERNPVSLSWGLSLQYSFIYLQSFVKDVGLGVPFNRMVLVAEFPMETCMSADCSGKTTGTINPGVVWAAKYYQLGIAAQIPVNARSGRTVGVLGLVHLFLDDLYPKGIGNPVFP